MRAGNPCKLALALCLAIPFALAACGGGGGTAPNPQSEEPVERQPEAGKAPPALIARINTGEMLIRYDGSDMEQIPKPANLTLENFNIAAGHSPYTDFLDLKVGPTYYAPWANSLPDWDGISMVRGTGCVPSAPMGKCASGTLTKTSTMDAGYLQYSAFFLFESESRDTAPAEYEGPLPLVAAEMFAYSLGTPSGTNPQIYGTWEGGMIGKREMFYRPAGNLLTGDASITVGMGGSGSDKVSVRFTNIVDSVTGAKHIPVRRTATANVRQDAISWTDIPLKNGVFMYKRQRAEDPVTDIYGSFYGPAHQEVGGIFEGHTVIEGEVNSHPFTGSFGARKQ